MLAPWLPLLFALAFAFAFVLWLRFFFWRRSQSQSWCDLATGRWRRRRSGSLRRLDLGFLLLGATDTSMSLTSPPLLGSLS